MKKILLGAFLALTSSMALASAPASISLIDEPSCTATVTARQTVSDYDCYGNWVSITAYATSTATAADCTTAYGIAHVSAMSLALMYASFPIYNCN